MPGERLLELVQVMARLRRECPWDQRQTHESLVRYLLEETYELVEAIEDGDAIGLREELGDLLLQVVFHAAIASEYEKEPFDIDDVAAAIVDKLVSRHPHVFAGVVAADAAEVERNWATLKAAEKARTSPLDGIPMSLPALSLAEKVASRLRAACVPPPDSGGPDRRGGPDDGLRPDGAEDALVLQGPDAVGAALFAIAVKASEAGIDPEQALRRRVRQEMATLGASVAQRALPEGGDARS